MRAKPLCLGLLSLLALAGSSFAAGDLTAARYELTVIERTRTPDGKIVEEKHTATVFRTADGRERIEDSKEGQAPYRIRLAYPDNPGYDLNPATRTYSPRTDNVGHFVLNPVPHPFKFLGTKSIQGLTCGGSLDAHDNSSWEFWQCSDPALGPHPVVAAHEVLRLPDGTGREQHLTKVTEGVRVPEGFFEIPAGFRLVEGSQQHTR